MHWELPVGVVVDNDDQRPWTTAGGPDLRYDDVFRWQRRRQLTDAGVVQDLQRVEPRSTPSYGHALRALDLVWNCPDDEVVNVVGYRCAGCGSGREAALLAARCRGVA